jgi:hypothetical protein
MARIRITGLANLDEKTKRLIRNAIAKSGVKDQIAASIRNDSRKDGTPPPLTDKTIQRRKYLAQYNTTHPDYSASFSNLTLTGAFYNSLQSRYITAKNAFVFLFPSKKHPQYSGKQGKYGGKTATMAQIAKYQSNDYARDPFQILRKSEFIAKISGQLIRAVRQFVRR